MELHGDDVYAASRTAGDVARQVKWRPEKRTVEWWDGDRLRWAQDVTVLNDDRTEFRFEDGRGTEFWFRPLTLEFYRRLWPDLADRWTDLDALKHFLKDA